MFGYYLQILQIKLLQEMKDQISDVINSSTIHSDDVNYLKMYINKVIADTNLKMQQQ